MSSPMTVKIAVIVWTGGPILEMAYVQWESIVCHGLMVHEALNGERSRTLLIHMKVFPLDLGLGFSLNIILN